MDAKSLALLKEDREFKIKLKELDYLLSAVIDPFFTFDVACCYLSLSESYLIDLCKKNLIPHYNSEGGKIYFDRDELDEWIKGEPKSKTKK